MALYDPYVYPPIDPPLEEIRTKEMD